MAKNKEETTAISKAEKDSVSQQNSPSHYVGIGASAGGLEALEEFFNRMPEDTTLAFIVIQHLSPDYKSLMLEILSKRTKMPVFRAEECLKVEPGSVYLIPPKKNLTIFHGKLLLGEQDRSRGVNLPIDIFFRSLAEDQKEKSIGIVLSGTGSDGTRGIRFIKEHGGMIMVQDEESARFDGMPRSAIASGLADFILPPNEMPVNLISFVKHPYITQENNLASVKAESGLTRIFAMLREKQRVDFTDYKPSTIIRRIERRMTVNQIQDLKDYVRFLESYPKEINRLYRELLIGVTNFFRDPEVFEKLGHQYLPELLERKKNKEIRVWVAGCSTGEEAYSLAILIKECMEDSGHFCNAKVFATDVDRDAIAFAGAGVYPDSIVADLSPQLLGKYFTRKEDHFQVSRSIREMVVFAQHNLIKDPPFTNIEMLSCRNLLIYFQPILQKRVMKFFNFSLNPQGVLLLGNSESIGDMSDFFEALEHKHKIYLCKGRSGPIDTSYKVTTPIMETNTIRLEPRNQLLSPEDRIPARILEAIADDYSPFAMIVNEHMEIKYSLFNNNEYLELPFGKPSNDISKIACKELSIPMTTGIHKAFRSHDEIRYSNIRVEGRKAKTTLHIRVRHLPEKKGEEPLVVVTLTESGKNESGVSAYEQDQFHDLDKDVQQQILNLEQELQLTQENLQATIEELETSNEELQATNEELLASNEELQSTNEELQSVNEELHTVNAEHQRQLFEVTELNNDMNNLLEVAQIATMFLDEDLIIRKFTPQISNIFGIIECDAGRPFHHVNHFILDIDLNTMVQKIQSGNSKIDMQVKTKSGDLYLMRIIPYQIGKDINAGVVLSFTDIGVVLKLQSALMENQERFLLAQQSAKFGIWDWNVSNNTMEWSATSESIFGFEAGKYEKTYETFLLRVHPDDRSQLKEAMAASIKDDKGLDMEHRIVWPDGSVYWVSEHATVHRDANGNAIRMVGTVQEITERKHREEELEATNLAFNLEQATSIADQDGNIIKVNRAFTQLTGYTQNDVVGKNHRILQSEHHNKEFFQEMWNTLLQKDYWEGEIRNRHKSNETYTAKVDITVCRNDQKQVTHFVGHFNKVDGMPSP